MMAFIVGLGVIIGAFVVLGTICFVLESIEKAYPGDMLGWLGIISFALLFGAVLVTIGVFISNLGVWVMGLVQ
jgi:hypothetical protein